LHWCTATILFSLFISIQNCALQAVPLPGKKKLAMLGHLKDCSFFTGIRIINQTFYKKENVLSQQADNLNQT